MLLDHRHRERGGGRCGQGPQRERDGDGVAERLVHGDREPRADAEGHERDEDERHDDGAGGGSEQRDRVPAQSVEPSQLRLRGATRQYRVFFRLYKGGTPEGHDTITNEFVHHAMVFLHRKSLQTKVPIEERHHEQRSQPFRQACEPNQVGEQHSHIAPAPGDCFCARLREHVLQYSRIDILPKGLLHTLLGAQFLYEKIKGIGQPPHLIGRTDRQLYVEIALLNIAHGDSQRPHGSAKPVCDKRCDSYA